MSDLYLGVLILSVLSVAGFCMAVKLTRNASSSRCDLFAILCTAVMGWYIARLWDHVSLARLLPVPNLVILGNWFLPFAGFMAGLVWQRMKGTPRRRIVIACALPAVSFYSAIYPMLGEAPACADHWRGDVCMQTTPHTCSPASAATLLRAHGIEATEQEMVDLCLTRSGTTWVGLYRGLKWKTQGTPWDVELFESNLNGVEEQLRDGRPMILSIGIDKQTPGSEVYADEWGFLPGQPHSVVLFKFIAPRVAVVGDPAIGRELWSWNDLMHLWRGQGIRLVPRTKGMQVASHAGVL